ncbi:ATP synthase j chain-domain-containing protein [Pterulicium gracile]|uniref:ATP synthase j chain-domain-containing protein n=1 Tax=Pterulicium gracile TaxID=1884261 RepID=A0A5C3QZU1_9AGAR|nr:ATP synthase j chain-domain-containing protein [Pterula gracilis]
MAFFGLRAWPTPIVKPLWPFFIASGLTFYLVNKVQDMAVRSESTPDYAKDPRNPYAVQISKEHAAH